MSAEMLSRKTSIAGVTFWEGYLLSWTLLLMGGCQVDLACCPIRPRPLRENRTYMPNPNCSCNIYDALPKWTLSYKYHVTLQKLDNAHCHYLCHNIQVIFFFFLYFLSLFIRSACLYVCNDVQR